MKKSPRTEEHENHDRWLVSYADFITLLFAFFVVMYATSNNNEEKQQKFENSMRASFKLGDPKDGHFTAVDLVPELANSEDGFPKKGGPQEIQDYISRQLEQNLGAEEKEKLVQSLRHDFVGVRISLAASSFFPTGESRLKFSSLKSLDQVAAILNQTNRKVIVEGHTDDLPVANGKIESNWELASLRATSVVRYFIKYHQIAPARLAAISYADQKPMASNDSEANRAKNRRIEILIVNPDSQF